MNMAWKVKSGGKLAQAGPSRPGETDASGY